MNASHPLSLQRGVSMIEMLITLVILSIGLLGIAGLQSRGQLATQASYTVTQSVTQAYDIMDRIRTNALFAVNDVVLVGGNGYAVTEAPSSSVDCETTPCSQVALKDYDLAEWYKNLGNTLPLGTGSIAIASSTATTVTYTITIQWTLKEVERQEGGEATRQQQWALTVSSI